MPCDHPLQAWRSKTVNATGKRSLVFDRKRGFTDMPVQLPCGQCLGCRLEKSRQWAMRIMSEASCHEATCFLTLTYSPEALPSNGSLVKKDLQNFFKQLRNAGHKIRYYACGEYGENFQRPHYHVILFGYDFPDRRVLSRNRLYPLFQSDELKKLWPHGHSSIGSVSFDTAQYTAGYVTKKITGKKSDNHYNGLQSEFAIMSLKPGIGDTWFKKYHRDVYPSDEYIIKGKPMKPPKFFDTLLERQNPILHKKIKHIRKAAALKKPMTLRDYNIRGICRAAKIKSGGKRRNFEGT
jgi:hypothetical protein